MITGGGEQSAQGKWDPCPILPVPLGSVDSDSLHLWIVILRAQRDLQRTVAYERRDLKSYLYMKCFSFGEGIIHLGRNWLLEMCGMV